MLVCDPAVAGLVAVVLGPVLVLLPPMPDPVDPAVCASAQANAPSKTGAANHIRFIIAIVLLKIVERSASLLSCI